ncbi:MAG TPA: isocitrate lyase/phosphoenolpyruvate mutase family protein [Parafilimonas sp.]|nr:isocitrate lyase/phosphoenolpyruvate mutase family protein [Parafilimonas sp.]
MTHSEKAEIFHSLHHSGKLLILPNIWDPLGALLLESLGYQAVATASAAVALSQGYDDGENIPIDRVFDNLQRITSTVDIPVTTDFETGYADDERDLYENIKALLQTGVAGINIEDTSKKTRVFLPIETQCNKIRIIKRAADDAGMSLFVNARTDVMIRPNLFTAEDSRMEEIIKRAKAYKDAGADCFFPIALKDKLQIEALLAKIKMPVNLIAVPGIPSLNELQDMGVARLSLGPSFLKIAVKAMKDLATQLKDFDGLKAVLENDVTTDYLKRLVNKS